MSMIHDELRLFANSNRNSQNVGDHIAGQNGVVVVVGVIGQQEAQLLGILDVAGQFEFIDLFPAESLKRGFRLAFRA